MTEDELEKLIMKYPTLYHMAAYGSWDSIKTYGLLSTSALLDLHSVPSPERDKIEKQHRSKCKCLSGLSGLPEAVIRDQNAMSDEGLKQCLPPNMRPSMWYKTLNSKCFFWLTKKRLENLLGARAYRDKKHDVLEICTRSLIMTHRDKIWLCPINSGATKPRAYPRCQSTFRRIECYPYTCWYTKRRGRDPVVELAVDDRVRCIRDHIKKVVVKMATGKKKDRKILHISKYSLD